MPSENNTFGKIIGSNFNDGQVIAVTNKESLSKKFSTVDNLFLKEEELMDDRTNLGMIRSFENRRIIKTPFMSEALLNHDNIYVNGMRGSFTYDIEMDFDKPVVVHNVEEGDYLGVDGSYFDIKLSHPYRQGDILTYDPIDGEQVVVAEDSEVIDEGDGFVHTVQLTTRDKTKWFPKEKLVSGTEFMKVGAVQGEYTEQFSSIDLMGMERNKVTMQYTLGDFMGVEVGISRYGEAATIDGKRVNWLAERINRMQEMYGGDLMLFGKLTEQNKVDPNQVKVMPLVKAMVIAELMKSTAMKLMWAKGGLVTGINGSKIINEGIYPQLRRGNRFVYKNIAELRNYIQRASEIIYHGRPIQIHDRRLVFRAGFQAFNLVREMFKEEFKNTVTIPIDQQALPVNILEGSDRYNLAYKSYAIGEAFLNGIGNVRVEHDPTLDFDNYGDYIERGYSQGFSKRSWTLVMWDISSPEYSNLQERNVQVKGAEYDTMTTPDKNLYMVRPKEMPAFSYGEANGFSLMQQGQNFNPMLNGSQFRAASAMSAWIPDKSRVVMIEKEETRDF